MSASPGIRGVQQLRHRQSNNSVDVSRTSQSAPPGSVHSYHLVSTVDERALKNSFSRSGSGDDLDDEVNHNHTRSSTPGASDSASLGRERRPYFPERVPTPTAEWIEAPQDHTLLSTAPGRKQQQRQLLQHPQQQQQQGHEQHLERHMSMGGLSAGGGQHSAALSRANSHIATVSAPQLRRELDNTSEVLAFVAKLTTAATTTMSLDTLMESLGYVKRGEHDAEDHDSSSSSGSDGSHGDRSTRHGTEFTGDDTASMMTFSQGLRFSASSSESSAIRRGVLQRFSSHLTHGCWIENNTSMLTPSQQHAREHGQPGFKGKGEKKALAMTVVPHHAVVSYLCIDIAQYSTIAEKLASSKTGQGDNGAHALAKAVNKYFESILQVAGPKFGGDVVSFAGDQVCVVWPVSRYRTAVQAVVAACACAIDIKSRIGSCTVEVGDSSGGVLSDTFSTHMCVCFGRIDAHVFKTSPTACYPFISGHILTETNALLDFAAAGEVTISCAARDVAKQFLQLVVIGDASKYENSGSSLLGSSGGNNNNNNPSPPTSPPKQLQNSHPASPSAHYSHTVIFKLVALKSDWEDCVRGVQPPKPERSPWIDKSVIPPGVATKLAQGFKISHIAEIRFLCVLFIHKKFDIIATESWFFEVAHILDEMRASVVQCIMDEKGVHVVAAAGLYHAEANPASVGIKAAQRLVDRQTGCVIGVAAGKVFAGLMGSDVACRWDISGTVVVRAARLMQHGIKQQNSSLAAIFDESVAQSTDDASLLEEIDAMIHVKGSAQPVRIYTLAAATVSVTAGLLSSGRAAPSMHHQARLRLQKELLGTGIQRGVALVSGPIGCGKRKMITMALEAEGIHNCIAHTSTRDKGPLCLAGTLADYFSFHPDEEIAQLGRDTRIHLDQGRVTMVLNLLHTAVNTLIERGFKMCCVVLYAHLLDHASIDFVRSVVSVSGQRPVSGDGRMLFVFTCYFLWGKPSPADMEAELSRPLKENERLVRNLTHSFPRRDGDNNQNNNSNNNNFSNNNFNFNNGEQHSFDGAANFNNFNANSGSAILPSTQSSFFNIINELNGDLDTGAASPRAIMQQTQTLLPHIKLEYCQSAEELADAWSSIAFYRLRPDAAEVLLEATGGCVMLLQHIQDFFRARFLSLTKPSKGAPRLPTSRFIIPRTITGEVHCVSAGRTFFLSSINWMNVAPGEVPRFCELYDHLPAHLQLLVRVVASLCRSSGNGSAHRAHAVKTMTRLNSKMRQELVNNDIQSLIEAQILREKEGGGGNLRFCVPACVDIICALFTPEQGDLLKRAAYRRGCEQLEESSAEQRAGHEWPLVVSFVARLALAAGEEDEYRRLMHESWQLTLLPIMTTNNNNNNNNNNNCDNSHDDTCSNNSGMSRRFSGTTLKCAMENMLLNEHELHPALINNQLFEGLSPSPDLRPRPPSAADLDFESKALMPGVMVWVAEYSSMAPLALGAVAAALLKLCYSALANWLDHTKSADSKHPFLSDEQRAKLDVHVDALTSTIAQMELLISPAPGGQVTTAANLQQAGALFRGGKAGAAPDDPIVAHLPYLTTRGGPVEQCRVEDASGLQPRSVAGLPAPAPGDDDVFDNFRPPNSLAEERELLVRIKTKPRSAQEAEEKMLLFRAYHYKVVLPRRDRFVRRVHSVTDETKLFSQAMISAQKMGVKSAYMRLVRPYPIPDACVSAGLMDLATAGFVFDAPFSLQEIRDRVLRRKTATVDDFKALMTCICNLGMRVGEK